MEEKNELNDIILNKGGGSGGNKKVFMAIATFAIILIIVVVIMNRLNSGGSDNLPQAVLPPEPTETSAIVKEDPLFEPVDVIEEDPAEKNLDRIAQRLKEESLKEEETQVPAVVVEEKPAAAAPAEPAAKVQAPKPAPKPAPQPAVAAGRYYIQVGSFTRYKPNARFLKKITDSGYTYTYHKVTRSGATVNKVLVGPFGSEKEARNALKTIRKNIEPGAFVTKV
jgi:DedD protein